MLNSRFEAPGKPSRSNQGGNLTVGVKSEFPSEEQFEPSTEYLPFGLPDFSSRWTRNGSSKEDCNRRNDNAQGSTIAASARQSTSPYTTDTATQPISGSTTIANHNSFVAAQQPQEEAHTKSKHSCGTTGSEPHNFDPCEHFPASTMSRTTKVGAVHEYIPSAAAPRQRPSVTLPGNARCTDYRPVAIPRKEDSLYLGLRTYISSDDESNEGQIPDVPTQAEAGAFLSTAEAWSCIPQGQSQDNSRTVPAATARSTDQVLQNTSDSDNEPLRNLIRLDGNYPHNDRARSNQLVTKAPSGTFITETANRWHSSFRPNVARKRRRHGKIAARLPRTRSPDVANRATFPSNFTYARSGGNQIAIQPSSGYGPSQTEQSPADLQSQATAVASRTRTNSGEDFTSTEASQPRSPGLDLEVHSSPLCAPRQSVAQSSAVSNSHGQRSDDALSLMTEQYTQNQQRLTEVNRHMKLLLEEQSILLSKSDDLMQRMQACKTLYIDRERI